MKPLLLYLFETLCCSGMFLLLYRLLVVGRVNFTAARCYLVITMWLSVVIPALELPLYPAETLYLTVPLIEADTTQTAVATLAEAVATEEVGRKLPTTEEAMRLFYLAITLVGIGMLLFHLWQIGQMRRKARLTQKEGYTLAEGEHIKTPFSFWKTIFLGVGYAADERAMIICHEEAHIRHRHSVERLGMELLRTLCWFNPFVWIAARRLEEVQEWQADRDTLGKGWDVTYYRLTILKQIFGYNPDIACHLSNSFTKKRFLMMTQSNEGARSLWRIGAAIPLATALILAFGATAQTPEVATPETPSIGFCAPAAGKTFRSTFGTTRNGETGETYHHPGIDIVLDEGANIYAVAEGEVVEAGHQAGYGNGIRIAHAEGYSSFYAHLKEIDVAKGERVNLGRVIGTAGKSGRATGVHLHFELRQNDKPIDPAFLMDKGSSTIQIAGEDIYMNGLRVSREQMGQQLKEYRANQPNGTQTPIVLDVNGATPMGKVTAVKETMREAEVLRITYPTQQTQVLPPAASKSNDVKIVTTPQVKSRNLFQIFINAQGKILCGTNEQLEMQRGVEGALEYARLFLTNPKGVRELSEQTKSSITLPDGTTAQRKVSEGFISIVTSRQTPYEVYNGIHEGLFNLITELREEAAQSLFGKELANLTRPELEVVWQAVPMRIFETDQRD
ncbi:MAG: peptidoglycan DD-metalloendopeptidase family protein [Alistipes sp.]|nr:peptidoglycan DD-metalloendopeptidase family protein [Alistipes sp.]